MLADIQIIMHKVLSFHGIHSKMPAVCYHASICLVFSGLIILCVPEAFSETLQIKMVERVDRLLCGDAESCFSPSVVYVKEGDFIQFFNADGREHSVRSGKGQEHDVGKLFFIEQVKPNNMAELEFPKEGTYHFHCMYHPWMRGMILVATAAVRDLSEPATNTKELSGPLTQSTDTEKQDADIFAEKKPDMIKDPLDGYVLFGVLILVIIVIVTIVSGRIKSKKHSPSVAPIGTGSDPKSAI